MSDSIIEIKNVSKMYKLYNKPIDRLKETLRISQKKYHRDHYALKDINLDIKKGEIVGIIGTNGAGKSTLLKMVTGVITPTSGTIRIKGKISALLELGTGFNPEYNGIENIYLNGTMMGYSKEEMDKKIEEIVEFADIGEFVYQPIKTYSSGMFARLAFAVAINVEPDILIADEILSVGDINFQNKCIEKMKKMVLNGTTILFVSHDLHAIKYFCERVIRLNKGKVIEDGNNVVEILDRFERDILPDDSVEKYEVISNSFNSSVKIHNTYFVDFNGKKKNAFEVGEDFKVIIEYEILNHIENIFLGVGMRNSRNVYINGLNTKLDNVRVKNSIGKHKIELEYRNINLYKDIYTVWSVCYNESGTVVFSDYIMKDALEIFSRKELGEGVIYIPHHWRYHGEI
mgnify:CR=1 FL=1